MTTTNGLPWDCYPVIIVQEHETGEQVRRHRKKRINKKWLKRYGTHWGMLDPGQIIFFDGKLLMSRRTYKKLRIVKPDYRF